MKKFGLLKLAALTTTAALLLTDQLTSAAYAAGNSVKVSLPTFPVQINGGVVDPSKAQYPPIVYKDITYLPLTWDYTRSLSLEYTWSDSQGLHVYAQGNRYQEPPAADKNSSNRKSTYTAELVTYPVFVNDKPIDNQAEEYPLLSFRDITYFPMTWHFMHDEFYMNLFWSPKDGFAVVGPQRHYLSSFVNDSADYLYLNSGSQMFKIRKSLTEQPSLLTEEENQKVSSLPPRADAEPLPKAEFASPDSAIIERKEKTFYYRGQELLSLMPMPQDGTSSSTGFMERSYAGLEYKEAWLDLGSGRNILSVVETDTNNQIFPDFSTYYRYFFVDGNVRPVPVNGFTHWPISSVQQNPNGTWWLTSRPITGDYITGRNGFITGELSLLQPNGQSVSVNRQLKIDEIEVLSHKEDGTLIFRAYTRTLEKDNPAFGIYKIDTSGKLAKLDDLFGQAYVSSDGDLWATDRYINLIVNISKNLSKLWLDYEFPFPDHS
ncbi:hypothetical protein GC098_28945 [Paenibacillus sp. LMG 31458]|uniref:Uncharacterized protein n=1 Tax=Paenibacillus phytorum TaxID=2654977 RepID=A0ABX1Y686_9BACL|nr:hypothetical protein [Paenibacillus phytorum]NOU75364.1 hypothetical protein [Paenibacillus phytorum]